MSSSSKPWFSVNLTSIWMPQKRKIIVTSQEQQKCSSAHRSSSKHGARPWRRGKWTLRNFSNRRQQRRQEAKNLLFRHGVSKTDVFDAIIDLKNNPFRTCFFDSAAKSNIRTAGSKREFFSTRPRAGALGLVPKKLIVFRPWYEITILSRKVGNNVSSPKDKTTS